MDIILSKKEAKNVVKVVGYCCIASNLRSLWGDLDSYKDDGGTHDKIFKYSENHKIINPIRFDNSTMTLTLDDDGLDFLNAILALGNLELLEDEDLNNPSGLIFNIKVKK